MFASVHAVNENVMDLEGNAAHNLFGYRYTDRMSACSIQKINRLFEQDFRLFKYGQIVSNAGVVDAIY
jgi:hypothetical protein